LKRTLLAIEFAIPLSLMLAPHRGRGLFRFGSHVHAPFLIATRGIAVKQLVSQTIFIAVLFALIINIPWRRPKKDGRD
jgi:hypothetical protein